MRQSGFFFVAIVAGAAWPLCAQTGANFFESRVRAVLAKNCYACHTGSELGGLRVDSRERLLRGGKSGPAIVPGKANESLLLRAVARADARLKMPPQAPLTEREIEDLRTWIDGGAEWPETPAVAKGPDRRAFWSFQPVRKPRVPETRRSGWARNDLDRFVLARMEEEGLTPSAEADRRTLIRRLSFDLTGLPPTPEEVRAFVADTAVDAYERVVERLLASPRYGERWARHWLDLARYSDGTNAAREDTPLANAYRYRDWVVSALNADLPYDRFVRSQIAADSLEERDREKHLAALGFQAIGESDNDRLDVTTRVFLGLTVGCAQCHDHKFDPIPTRDYYSLLGVFKSSKVDEYPLVDGAQVKAYKEAKAASEEKKAELKRFLDAQIRNVTDYLAAQTSQYIVAAWRVMTNSAEQADAVAARDGLDAETLGRWVKYLKAREKDHGAFAKWNELVSRPGVKESDVTALARELEQSVRTVLAEKKTIDDRNYVKLGGIEGMKDTSRVIGTLVDALPVERYYFWRDMASGPYKIEDIVYKGGVYYYDSKQVERFLGAPAQRYLKQLREESAALEKAIPKPYPFWHVLKDAEKPADIKVAVRGDASNPGEIAPRRFLGVLCDGEPALFRMGSGRAELAEAIISPKNPLTSRVIVNRLWQHHFGEGIVRSTSNFGQLGDRPTHPELLDYLAASLVESGWSLKAMHRMMVLSSTYRMRSEAEGPGVAKDPDNRLLWRANVQERLDAESLRDAVLAASGTLDSALGGAPKKLSDDYGRRTLYTIVSRGQPDRTMALFDFPDANTSTEQRITTVGPMQRLFFMNSGFVARQSEALVARVRREAAGDREQIGRMYELLYGRPVSDEEARLGMEFLGGREENWPRYAQVLLAAAEFSTVK
ncbi:MAG: PSD1 domain-containing protein [Acidobacteria bacterium]|nr:PSD1 domain-containing protein [Acidobacteriota bacterium]